LPKAAAREITRVGLQAAKAGGQGTAGLRGTAGQCARRAGVLRARLARVSGHARNVCVTVYGAP